MTVKQIEQLLKDYHWMINLVIMMREYLKDIRQVGLAAQYGVEEQGGMTDSMYMEVIRRSKDHETVGCL